MIQLLTGLTEALYDIIVFLYLVPKTFVRIARSPRWIRSYVAAETAKAPADQFDDYAHPILFFLLLGVCPFLVLSSIVPNLYPSGMDRGADLILHKFLSLELENKVLGLVVFLASWPLAAAVVIQRARDMPTSRSSLKPLVYVQAYFFGWLYFVCGLASPFLVYAIARGDTLDSLKGGFLIPKYALTTVILIFFFVELRTIRDELAVGWARALGLLVKIYFAGAIMMLFGEIVVLVSFFSAGLFGGGKP
jgi:hypothetical protein